MHSLAQQRLLSVEGVPWSYGDAVLLGLVIGLWMPFERRVAAGLALQRAGHVPDREAVGEALIAFRRSRRLLAAEDLRTWMVERDLDRGDLEACVARRVLRETAGPDAEQELLDRAPPPDAAVAAVLRAEAFVDGVLEECALALAEHAAAAAIDRERGEPDRELVDRLVATASSGPDRGFGPELRDRATEVLRAYAAHRRFLDAAAATDRLRERLSMRRLDLTRVRFEELRLHSRDAAREAQLCLQVDGMALPQVAVRANVACTPCEAELGELPAGLRAAMAAGRPGELVGPVADEDSTWRLAVVQKRQPPTLEDPAIRRRLADEVGGRALARRMAGRVSWHGHV